ncbi:MAG: RNA polymerase sigma factor [Bacteroidia bacterium]|nr:RNA polymerase sigma factor [Bacteroidia bacterium]
MKSEIFDEKRLNLMLGYAFSFLGSKEDAEDVVQGVIVKLLGKPLFAMTVRNVDAFLIRSVRNACIDFIRVRKIKTPDFGNLEASGSSEDWSDRDLLRAAMARLPDKQRMIVYLKDVSGYTTEEIAKMLDVSDGQIRTTLSRARKSLREYIIKTQNYGV